MNYFSILFFIFVAQNQFSKIETVGTIGCLDSNNLSTCEVINDNERCSTNGEVCNF
jgi:hypothetical protein